VDADARTFLVKITLPQTAGLRSGTFGRAHFQLSTRRALTVPASAVVRRGQLSTVMVVEQDVARVRLVNMSGTEVLAGLSAGDVVVVAAPQAVTDGRHVTIRGRQ
jgi:hypothetical protein